MSAPNVKITPEDRLDTQISLLTDMLMSSAALVKSHTEKNLPGNRQGEIDRAMNLARRSAEVATALAKLRGTFTFNVRREGTPAVSRATAPLSQTPYPPAVIADELDRELGPVCTQEELDTLGYDEVRARYQVRRDEIARRVGTTSPPFRKS
jgi:hypothetical protein